MRAASCPPATVARATARQELLDRLGRHGQRPAHIHFFVSAPGHRHLTTQINLAGDRYLWDDFAYATRDGLIGDLRFNDDPAAARDRGVEGGRFAELDFDFQLQASPAPAAERRVSAAAGIAGVRRGAGRAAGRWRPCRLLPPGATADKRRHDWRLRTCPKEQPKKDKCIAR